MLDLRGGTCVMRKLAKIAAFLFDNGILRLSADASDEHYFDVKVPDVQKSQLSFSIIESSGAPLMVRATTQKATLATFASQPFGLRAR